MLITLAEALPLRVQLSRKLHVLRSERESASKVVLISEDDPNLENLLPARTMGEVSEEIRCVINDYILLDQLISTLNVTTVVEWKGNDVTILAAINTAKEYRKELASLKDFGARQKVQRNSNPYRSEPVNSITKMLYDPKIAKEQADELEKFLTRLSAIIEKKNHQVEFEFAADKYMA